MKKVASFVAVYILFSVPFSSAFGFGSGQGVASGPCLTCHVK